MPDGPNERSDTDLNAAERAEIDGMYLRLASSNFYELLGIATNADRKAIRDAYFALSQKFHPDAWFGRKLGPWKARVEQIFREATRAYDVLGNRNQRKLYDDTNRIVAEPVVETPPSPPVSTPAVVLAPAQESSPIIPKPSVARAPEPAKPVVAGPKISVDHLAAQRAARESLARRLGRPSTGGIPVTQVESPVVTASAPNTLQALRSTLGSGEDIERKGKLAHYLRLVDESEKANDWVSASNTMVLALSLSPDEPGLKARSEALTIRAATILADKFIEQARGMERAEKWKAAAEMWQKASVGRPKDASLLIRASTALLRSGQELPRAVDLARRVIQLAPKNVEGYALLAEIYIEGGMPASAQAALDTASKLDPTAAIVKDLQTRLKG